MKTLEDINKELNKAEEEYQILANKDYPTYELYSEVLAPLSRKIDSLDRHRRMIMPYELKPIDNDEPHIMSIEDFISSCKDGSFIDYDGFGYYLKNGMETDIKIYPSDVKYNSIRKEFTKIIWFNR